ncbi:2,4-dienoyl-CoA reductase [NADPH] [Alkalibacterium sp. AK22]|uniref:NADH:flavin oxidoreductase/NADH oxidase family protein n=1 Tax=Alkalibacterium sp. AK22 TaxID=1229520 RepID=UPI000446E0E5|nr:NADH:flavin oxidoreductase/NADH oxidase family protein [Alkalibacterium sp. AK22]EXJ22953.1 2,4-dienoyl-CoA reductase [NADPH] [Alkalibacterium sp. AK22]
METLRVKQPMTLPNGRVIKNRFFKSAMSEAMADKNNSPTKAHLNLYSKWAEGGAGIVVSGNVMVDRAALGEPGNVVVEDERDLPKLKEWAQTATVEQTELWMQINHPGRQSPKSMSSQPVAPSAVPLRKPYALFFASPKALTLSDIDILVNKFVSTALVAKKAGFTGVQIHAAHGYLVSQFLSPLTNQRQDQYGGSLNNRLRFLIDIYYGMRQTLGKDFSISVKLNSSDFSPGGFTGKEATEAIKILATAGIDLVEISGGSYENPHMFQSVERETIFFLDYAEQLMETVDIPLVVTGGFRTLERMEQALEQKSTSMIGLARPLALYPDLPRKLMNGEMTGADLPRLTTGIKHLDKKIGGLMAISYYEQQMKNIASGRAVDLSRNGWKPLITSLKGHGLTGLYSARKSE